MSQLEARSPFAPAPPDPGARTTFERLTGKARPDLARQALARYLALTPSERLDPNQFNALTERYGLDSHDRHTLRVWIYETALLAFWDGREPSVVERGQLVKFRRFGDIDVGEAQRLHAKLTEARFMELVDDACDHAVPSVLPRTLRDLAQRFAFDDPDSRSLYASVVERWKKRAIEDCKKRGRLTLEEFNRDKEIAEAFGSAFTEVEENWLRCAFLYDYLERGEPIPPIANVPINLQKSETCYGSIQAAWVERMARAIKTDHGTAYFTNSRLIFEGGKKPVVIRLSAILGIADAHSFVPNFSAIQLRKASGTSPELLVPEAAAKMTALLLTRLLRGDIGTSDGSAEAPIEEKPQSASQPKTVTRAPSPAGDSKGANDPLRSTLASLEGLVGLTAVRSQVTTLVNIATAQQRRRSEGLPVASITYHCVFTGNPGTGKTTVARLLAQIFKALGLLSKGHLVETDRSGLVGGYVGQTALKTSSVVQSAVGGILFVDEAYALANPGENDYGREAVDTLLKLMEDNRDDLVVIVAGYPELMERFVQSNPGLRSRFARYIDFPDYDPPSLLEILLRQAKESGYQLASDAVAAAERVITAEYESRSQGFGNGRFVRNLFESMLANQANRLASFEAPTRDDLMTLTASDVNGSVG